MTLSGTEARDLARHLIRSTDERFDRNTVKAPAGAAPDGGWVETGKKLFTTKGCINCHAMEKQKPTLNAKIQNATNGCLSETADVKKVPIFKLEAEKRAALVAYLNGPVDHKASPFHAAKVGLSRFGCINCHVRDGEGGIGLDLADRMKKLENAQNADDVQPPRLTGIGHKARTPWLSDVLLNKGRARPWMTLRMPQYGADHVGLYPAQFPAIEGTTTDDKIAPGSFTKSVLEVGKELAGKNGHGCISCHDISGVVGGGTRGPDLALTAQHVRFEWFERWMHNPQRLAPGTKMPSVYVDGKALLTKFYDGDSAKQNAALWAYFALGPGLPLPFGLEPPKGLIIAVKDRPEILRTFLPDGAGTRAIAVGYPGGVSIAFDAHAARLSYVWQGNFLDASPVWNNRGGAPAKLLGPKIFSAPAGHPWALSKGDAPNFAKRADDPAFGAEVPLNTLYAGPMNIRFAGYSTDTAGKPSFRYELTEDGATLKVSETPSPASSGVSTGLKRDFSVEVPPGLNAYFVSGETTGEIRTLPGAAFGVVYPAANGRAVLQVADSPGQTLKLESQAGPNGTKRTLFKLSPGKHAFTFTTWMLAKDDPALIDAVLSGK
jgi:mono/diheme cytochrome c family protein